MSKTNSESRELREPEERELRDDEVALVSGGGGKTNVLGTAAVMWGAAVDAVLEGVVIPLVTTL